MKTWPFKVAAGPGGKPLVEVRLKGETKRFAAEEISSMVLLKMKDQLMKVKLKEIEKWTQKALLMT